MDSRGQPLDSAVVTSELGAGACINCRCNACKVYFNDSRMLKKGSGRGSPAVGQPCNGGTGHKHFPTEARLRQKERLKSIKAQGKKPVERKQHVEDGHDDCVDSFAGLGLDVAFLSFDLPPDMHALGNSDKDKPGVFHKITAVIPGGIGNAFQCYC